MVDSGCKSRKASAGSLPSRTEGLPPQTEPTWGPGICSGAIYTCQRFHPTLSQMGLEIFDWTSRRKWLYHSATHLLMSSGWAGKLSADDRFRIQMLLPVYFKTTFDSVPSESILEAVEGSHMSAPIKGMCTNSTYPDHVKLTYLMS